MHMVHIRFFFGFFYALVAINIWLFEDFFSGTGAVIPVIVKQPWKNKHKYIMQIIVELMI